MCVIKDWIIIDQFTFKKYGCIYFLTHWHSDHYAGISSDWDFGEIYCSIITSKLLLSKYPKLQHIVKILPYEEATIINHDLEEAQFRIFDSNHMAGSIMLLISYEKKFYLHSGDMRFNKRVAQNNPYLFKQQINGQYKCNYQIHKLYLDNTFCDPIFQFPSRAKVMLIISNLIVHTKPNRIFLCTDSVGKEECFIALSKYYKTKIILNSDRYEYVSQMNLPMQKYFSLDAKQGWIEVIRKKQRNNRVLECGKSIAITLTGWANINDYHQIGYNNYIVPYSLHSNFEELDMFVNWIRPQHIIPIVQDDRKKSDKFRQKIGTFESYMSSLYFMKQRGLQFFIKQYCTNNE